jgi:hypothetical protein
MALMLVFRVRIRNNDKQKFEAALTKHIDLWNQFDQSNE